MATLKELMGDITRGDGRKFRMKKWKLPHDYEYAEPIFRTSNDFWHGVTNEGNLISIIPDDSEWEEWHPPAKKVKKKVYRALTRHYSNVEFFARRPDALFECKEQLLAYFDEQDLIGIIEEEIEYEEIK